MQFLKILTPVLAGLLLGAAAPVLQAQQSRNDEVLVQMNQAYRKGDKARLTQLLPLARGHTLEPWAAYWELKARLQDASPDEVAAFLARYAGSYQEDRLRNDWLLLLGQRRDWGPFAAAHPAYRMSDDREVRCYALLVDHLRGSAAATPLAAPGGSPSLADEVRRNWLAIRDADDGCTLAAGELLSAGQLKPADAWRKARLAVEANRPGVARTAVALVAPDASAEVAELHGSPARYLAARAIAPSRIRKELVTLALLRMAATDPDAAALQLDSKWSAQIAPDERNWVWGAIGRQQAQRLASDAALESYGRVTRTADLSDDMLAWKARAALRLGRWKDVAAAIEAMEPASRQDATWIYWRARTLLAQSPSEAQRAEATRLYQAIAGPTGFYEQLAQEELGGRVAVPPRPPAPTLAEREAARLNPALVRAIYAIQMGLRGEGTREWNYATNLHVPGGMDDRALLAAADLACQSEVWDRCINTSERTRSFADFTQRYPMPFQSTVVKRSGDIGLDPAYVYGLIRQESRFIMDARSGVGASGLMQVMPATAKWTANKIGLTSFTPAQIADRDTNITIGTAYLKLALDDFAGSMPLAAAGYNAGPGRPRNWRNGPVIEGAAWAENVPFAETRDYVKKVLANTTAYAAMLGGQPQSLKARLGMIGPKDPNFVEPNRDLP